MTGLDVKWESPPEQHEIGHDAVHVWRASFQPAFVSRGRFSESLSQEEAEKAWRFVRQSDRDRYAFSHKVLRSIIAGYIGCEPQDLAFSKEKRYHKPYLIGPSRGRDIQFSLSHSGDITLVAVSRESAVGIDVELVRKIPDAKQIIESFFSVDERRFFASLSPIDFDENFFVYWTSKEAFLKATGEGLSYPLDKFSVVFPHGQPEGSVRDHEADSFQTRNWKVKRLSPEPGYLAALVLAEPGNELKFFEYGPC